jgi:type II secretory pathway component PulF
MTDRLMLSRHQAWVLRLLAAAIAQGKTISAALDQLTAGWSAYPSPFIRRRLRDVRRRVERGQPWHEALECTRLIYEGDAGVLVAAQEAGNLPWAMRMLAGRKMRLTAFRWTIAQQILFTIVVLLFGLFVLWVGMAMLFPIADLTQNLAM